MTARKCTARRELDPHPAGSTVRPVRPVLWAMLSLACVRPPVPPAATVASAIPTARSAEPTTAVPDGCGVDLGGTWTVGAGGGLRYEAIDDGGTVRFLAFLEPPFDAGPALRRFSRDGGLPWLVRDAGAGERPGPRATLVLERTASGFSGLSSAVGEEPLGDAGCRPAFPVRVVACGPGGLELEALVSARIDADCRRLDGGVVQRQVLRRPGGGADERPPPNGG